MKAVGAFFVGVWHGIIMLIALSPLIVLMGLLILTLFAGCFPTPQTTDHDEQQAWADTNLYVGHKWVPPPFAKWCEHVESMTTYDKYLVYVPRYPSHRFVTVDKQGFITSVWSNP